MEQLLLSPELRLKNKLLATLKIARQALVAMTLANDDGSYDEDIITSERDIAQIEQDLFDYFGISC